MNRVEFDFRVPSRGRTPRTCLTHFCALAVCSCLLTGATSSADAAESTHAVASPNGQIVATVKLLPDATGHRTPAVSVSAGKRPILRDSPMKVFVEDSPPLGADSDVESEQRRSQDATYEQFPGKRRHVVDHFNELTLGLQERRPPKRRWELVVRAYDDGVAFRYRIPAQPGWDKLVVNSEETRFVLAADAEAYALPLNSFTTSYERRYDRRPVSQLPRDWLLGLPLLLQMPEGPWVAITEANLTDHAGMYLAPDGSDPPALVSRLSPLLGQEQVAVRSALPHASPWRVLLIADDPGRLIESDLLLNLNEPCAIGDTSWIKPGKTTFPWWNGFYETGVPFEVGLNTATAKYYIDFCAEGGIPYHSLDGKDDTAWYGGPIGPYQGQDPTKAIESIDLPEVLRHAKEKGVRLRLWMHWQAARDHMERAFPIYRQWGIEGVMIDFMDRDDQEMNKFQRKLIELAAANQLTVTMHGVAKPTGLERTYPNLLTSEGVLNLEYDKWDKLGVPPEHEVTVAFTRMLAGPLDFHQGSLRGVPIDQFKPQNAAPLVMGTPARMLACYVVFQNHLPMAADYPSAYRGHPALPMLAKIPCTWDDTAVIAAAVGQYVAIARKSGNDWYLGAMNDSQPREIELPLAFLGDGQFAARIFADDSRGKFKVREDTRTVTKADKLNVSLGTAGGYFMQLQAIEKR